MMQAFLRAPVGVAEAAADALRLVGALCIVIAAVGWGPIEAATIAFAAGGTLLPRLVGVRASVDIAFGVVVLTAAWSSVLEIYVTTRWWDLPMHFLTNGLCAALGLLVLVRLRVLADPATLPRPLLSSIVATVAIGLSLGVFWEIMEWFGHTFIDEEIFVGYVDSIGDLAWGGAGALLAGYCMPFLTGRSSLTTGR